MTKKHFEAIATVLQQSHDDAILFADNPAAKASSRRVVSMVARRLADTFKDFNPNFDKARFLKACGVSE